MSKNSTILSQKESTLIDNLIAKYGLFINFSQISEELKNEMNEQGIKNVVSKLMKRGWLVRLARGNYYITNLESRGTANVSFFVIAQSLASDTYISFEAALQHHGIFDQYLKTITLLSLTKHTTKTIQNIKYEFIKTSQKNFHGFEDVQIEGKTVKIATLEKAILDTLNFRRNIYSVDLVLEKLRENKDNFDLERLFEFSQKQSLTVARILGFLMDKVGLNSANLHKQVDGKSGSSYMTKDSKLFNAKWRLYYHNHFE